MADTIIIYYSLSGSIDFISRDLSKKLGADLFRLETVNSYPAKGLMKFLHGGKDALRGFKPELKTALPDISQYTTVVLASPVWASNPAAPLNTVLSALDFSGKKVAAFVSSAGGDCEKVLGIIGARLRNATLCAAEGFVNPLKNPEAALEKVSAFAEKVKA